MGQLLDVKFKWTIDDLLDAHEALDIKEEMESHLLESQRRA